MDYIERRINQFINRELAYKELIIDLKNDHVQTLAMGVLIGIVVGFILSYVIR